MKRPQAGQVWWTHDGEGQRWRVVMLESRHVNLINASWLARDMETWRCVWVSEERWDVASSKSRLMGPEAGDAEFYMFSSPRVSAAPLP